MRVLSWNLANRVETWPVLARHMTELDCAVALVQEARHPMGAPPPGLAAYPSFDDPTNWWIPIPADVKRGWCSAVVVRADAARLVERPAPPLTTAPSGTLAATHPGQFSVADVAVGDATVTVISLYGLWERMDGMADPYAEATLHRAISDLTPVFQAKNRHPIVLAGDLNIWHRFNDPVWGPRDMTIFDRLASYGLDFVGPFGADARPLEQCVCGPAEDCRHVQTFRFGGNPGGTPSQVDFVFATPDIRVVKCVALNADEYWGPSDHCPVLTEILS